MFQAKMWFAVFVFSAALLNAPVALAAKKPEPWHVKEAEIRIPVGVSIEHAWARMPPQVYLADLNPTERKELNFDRKTKSAILRDIRSPEDKANIIARLKERCRRNKQEWKPEFYRLHGNPIMRVRGTATYGLRPEYKWFSFRMHGHTEVHIDGKRAPEVLGRQDGIHPGDHRFPWYKREWAAIVRVPPGGKTLTIKADAEWIKQAGFLTSGPAVARVAVYLPAHDPTSLIPLVYASSGKRVGCRILWAYPGEPMSILFDCSSGEKQYWVYLVNRSKNPPRLNWAPKAGLIFESRYPNRYDPAVKTVDGFLKLWDAADLIAGKEERARIWKNFFPFRPFSGTTPNYRDVLRGSRMALSCYTGFFCVPDTQKYEFHYKAEPGGYFLIDNQLVSQFKFHEAGELSRKGSREGYKRFAVQLEKGLHRMEFLQYGSAGRFSTRLGWGLPGKETDLEPVGNMHHAAAFAVWEPVADAGADAISHREGKLHASFTWSRIRDHFHRHQWWGKYPGRDIILLSFTARLPKKPGGAIFRWQFDDGHTAEGERVEHYFLSPGTRKVELRVLDRGDGKVIASVSGKVHAHVNWAWPQDGERNEVRNVIAQRAKEFASVTPIEEVVSLYYWASLNHWPGLRNTIGAALAQRTDDVIKAYPYTRLREMAQSLGSPREARYDAAEKFLKAAMDRAPAGGRHWRSAALALTEILVAARGKPDRGLALLERLNKTKPTVDMTGPWQTADAKRWHTLSVTDNIAGVPGGLSWSNTALPLEVKAKEGRGIWLARDIHLPASRKGKELVLDLGEMPGSGVIWFNGKRVGRPWQWPDGNIVIPAAVQRAGGKNRFEVLFQPTDPPGYFAKRGAPTLKVTGPPREQAAAEVATKRFTADALLGMGKNEQAKQILLNLKPRAWPIPEKTQLKLTSDLRRTDSLGPLTDTDAAAALDTVNSWLRRHPLLRMDPEFMAAKIEAYVEMGDYDRAFTLAGQMRRVDMNEHQLRQLMLVQVKSRIKAGQMEAARKVYGELKKLAPYSTATVEAREAIKESVLKD